jgi:lysophospholipase L1-like esterase
VDNCREYKAVSTIFKLGFLGLALGIPTMAANGQTAKISVKKGDRIIFLGDSITQAGADPKGYVSLVGQAFEKNKKDLGVVVIGAGISGNKVPDLENRLDRDVLAQKPTKVVIYIGINDVWHGQDDPSRGTLPERFEAGLAGLVDRIRKSGAEVILATPSVIGEKFDGSNKLDPKLDQYSDITRKIAKEKNTGLCDLRKAFLSQLKKSNPENKEAGILTSDTVHLNQAGNEFVAEVILKCLGQ